MVMLVTSSFSFLLQVSVRAHGEEFQHSIIFQDDFEAYELGAFPSEGGWELVWNGRGDGYQRVTSEYWYSPTKSLQLWGQDWWSAVAERRFSSDSMIIGFEGYVLIESYSSKPSGTPVAARIYLWNRELATWGKLYAGVDFTYDGNITARHGLGTPTFGKWSPREWYRVKLVLDRSANTFDVWINGELVGEDISVLPEYQDTYNINALALYSDHAGVKVYFDDVKVFTQGKEFRYEYWLPWTDNTWPAGSDDLCSCVRFLIFEDNTIIQIDSDHNGVADAELSGDAGDKLMWGYATSYGSPKSGLDIFPPLGTLIKTNKPVSAFYYHTTNDWGIYDDHTYAYSLIPTFLLGCSYYIWTESTLASILSTAENNQVFIDENDDGDPEYSFTLGYGENYIYSNTKAGARIWAEKPIAVVVVNWDPSYDAGTYAYELYPVNMLSSEYSCPHPNPGIQYYKYSTSKCKVIIGAVHEDTTVNIDEDDDGVPEITQSLGKAQRYEYKNPKPGAKIYGTKEFYALYIFDVYARDPWANVYRDYMYAYMIPPASISGKQFLMLDIYESYHATYTSANIFVLEDETEIYVDRGFDGTTDETYQANEGEVINIVGKLRYNLTKITTNKPVTATYSWEGGWAGVSEAILGFTLIPLDILLPKINAIITAYSISPGEFKYGDKVSAQVTVKNTGQEAWTFYVGFSVQDPNGKWWDAPYETVTLNPNEERTVTLYWTVDQEAPAGCYNSRVAVWESRTDNTLYGLIDYRDEYNVFYVTRFVEICIKPDGSIHPATVPIIQLGNKYILTGNIVGNITIERSNIILDGNHFSLRGFGNGNGIFAENLQNITIRKVHISNFKRGIYLRNCANVTVFKNNVTNCQYDGALLECCQLCRLYANTFQSNRYGLFLGGTTFCSIVANNFTRNSRGLILYYCRESNNEIFHNNFINNEIQARTASSVASWNDDYPSGGNYWSDYPGVDGKSGPNQDQPGDDGIGDAPYILDDNNIDLYPLMEPWREFITLKFDVIDFEGAFTVSFEALNEKYKDVLKTASNIREEQYPGIDTNLLARVLYLCCYMRDPQQYVLYDPVVVDENGKAVDTELEIKIIKDLLGYCHSLWLYAYQSRLNTYEEYQKEWEKWYKDNEFMVTAMDYFTTITNILIIIGPIVDSLQNIYGETVRDQVEHCIKLLFSTAQGSAGLIEVYGEEKAKSIISILEKHGLISSSEYNPGELYQNILSNPEKALQAIEEINSQVFQRQLKSETINVLRDFLTNLATLSIGKFFFAGTVTSLYAYFIHGLSWKWSIGAGISEGLTSVSRCLFRTLFPAALAKTIHQDFLQPDAEAFHSAWEAAGLVADSFKNLGSLGLRMGDVNSGPLDLRNSAAFQAYFGVLFVAQYIYFTNMYFCKSRALFPNKDELDALKCEAKSCLRYATEWANQLKNIERYAEALISNKDPQGANVEFEFYLPVEFLSSPPPVSNGFVIITKTSNITLTAANYTLIVRNGKWHSTFPYSLVVDDPYGSLYILFFNPPNMTYNVKLQENAPLSLSNFMAEENIITKTDLGSLVTSELNFSVTNSLIDPESIIISIPLRTLLFIGEPKLIVDNITFLTSATPIELIAEGVEGFGVATIAYRIYNSSYDSGWTTYTQPFYLNGLSDGVYQIDYYSTDNAGNVEPINTARLVLFSWQHIYEDPKRGTTLKINTNYKLFQFITADKDFGLRQAATMYESYVTVYCKGEYASLPAVIIRHNNGELRLLAYAGTDVPFCYARALDYENGNRYMLRVDPTPPE